MKNEIVVYQAEETSIRLEVRIEDETVWLNRHQLAALFSRDVKTIGKHIANALKEELEDAPVVAKFATTAKDGKIYNVEYYNLDMILSIGYRVKSKQGVQFRIWANQVLKDFLLKGYAINRRVDRIENEMHSMKKDIGEIKLQLNTSLPPDYGIFFDGQEFDAYAFVVEIIKSAKQSIVLIDNYIDESVLLMLSKRNKGVKATVFTKTISKQLELDIKKHNRQYPPIDVKQFSKSHDRFLIIDNETMYHIGASLKDLGKNWVAFSKMDMQSLGLLSKLGL
jgi:hypothetical protein